MLAMATIGHGNSLPSHLGCIHLTCPMLWTARWGLGRWVRGTCAPTNRPQALNCLQMCSLMVLAYSRRRFIESSLLEKESLSADWKRVSLQWEQWFQVLMLKYLFKKKKNKLLALGPFGLWWVWVIVLLRKTLSDLQIPALIGREFVWDS
jgi:hypothetical protein